MATVARKDTGRAELLSSLDSGREEVARLKEALRHAEESVTLIAEDLAGLERSREQTLEKLGSTQERLVKLKNEAAKILSSSEDFVRASLQAELEQIYVDRLSSLEFRVLSPMQEEIEALHKNKTWKLVSLPQGRKTIGNKWVYKIKRNGDDQVERYRAILVVKGYAQKEGIDFNEIFSLLSSTMCPSSEEERMEMSRVPDASAVGSLMFVMICTRPDIAQAVGVVSRYMANPGKEHWNALIVINRKSTTGYVFALAGGAVSWVSKLQSVVATSTTEAEFHVREPEPVFDLIENGIKERKRDDIVKISSVWTLVRKREKKKTKMRESKEEKSLPVCRLLDLVDVGGNELDGILPCTVGNLSRTLTVLDVGDTHIKGKIPVELGNLSGLTQLVLGNNELVGTMPFEITTLQGLQYLGLASNRIHGSVPHELGRLSNLDTLDLGGNSLSGSIPDSLGNITGLERLTLFANRLSSTIPETIWSLTRLQILYLSQNLLTGSLPLTLWNMQGLYAFDVSVNQLSGDLPSPPKYLEINYLDLSNNSFDGHIPKSFGNLINLDVLNLSCNKITGVIPESLINLRHLSILNLSFNMLEGKVPNVGAFMNASIMSLEGNAALCGAPRFGFPSCNVIDSRVSNSRRHFLRYILPVIASVGILVLCFCILLGLRRRRAKSLAPTSMLSPTKHRLIPYYELVRATDNFSEINLLGRGAFGSVYRGLLDDGLLVAIKVLNLEIEGASRSFDAECRALRMVRHRNLVRIISACSNLDFKALVLQFMPNGSLERWLYSHNYCLSLLQRINIVVDVASALDYLHHHHPEVILHCDLKPSNILLDEEMSGHVSDFGIAKLLSGVSLSGTSASTAGTIGYIAPEFASTGRVSTKGDVYSFGILLLETFTRKKPTDPMFTGESSLRRWVDDANPTGLLDIVDCNLLKDENGNERPKSYLISTQACLSSIMELGIICSSDLPNERLAMKDVVPQLQKIKMKYMSDPFVA
ncbi:probable LRR receptor-like serine/threonine-protein kinase At3g47570 [Asparagus officinalis]|uniref:probable LRR receptor-like serine/threonine-protein kinase At3g47570 n=1 Tax=Asparagus officinalis TaxID=4686 RepID=UPI00098E30AD|nr:probable LRR receptor-like serine/threonine-protein kinase At3g47570 [Asparagus officinalis]